MPTEQELDRYLRSTLSPGNDLLNELEQYTFRTTVNPRMISGRIQGRLLQLLVSLKQPRNILEIGTFTGYSALAMAMASNKETQITTIDINDEFVAVAKQFTKRAGLEKKINFIIGKAQDKIPALPDNHFDIIFIDGEKDEYPTYYQLVFSKLKDNGLLLIDNVLWNGKVFDEKARQSDKKTKAVIELTRIIQADKRVRNFILPLRDGLMVVEKI